MEILFAFKEYWAVLSGVVAIIVWLVRIEAGMKRNRHDIERISEDLEKERHLAIAARATTTSKLDSISDVMQELHDDTRVIQKDIKYLLERK